jgi:hypothetical protein
MKVLLKCTGSCHTNDRRAKCLCINGIRIRFRHGVADAKLDNTNTSKIDYVDQPGKGLDNHTPQFANGYVKGWCSIMGPNHGKELDDTVFDCERTN